MRATEFIFENNDDSESGNLKSIELARQNISRILSAAQRIYDDWDESDRDTYAGGGICHIIADAICDVMWNIGIECTTVSCSYEQHVYVAVKVEEGVYTIDIPYSIYETGGGFNWQKLPDIKFDTGDVVFYKVSGDPEEFENYTALEESQQDVAGNFTDGVIKESFDQPYPIIWSRGEYGDVDGFTTLADGSRLELLFNLENKESKQWMFQFYRDDRDDVSGQGDAQRVFATVLNALKIFLRRRRPNRLHFSASRETDSGQKSQSRSNLYTRLVQRYAPTWGYNVEIYDDGGRRVEYVLTPKVKQKTNENFADGKNPGRKGLAKRMGVPTKASVSRLRQIAKSSSGEKARMAHWMANMKAGKRK